MKSHKSTKGSGYNLPQNLSQKLLHEFIEGSIMGSADSVLDDIMATQREKIKKVHPYATTPPATEKGRWQTRYCGADGKHRNIKAQTENQLLDKLIILYFSDSYIDNLIFYDLFEEWLEYKTSITGSPNTIKRHRQHYNKYFAPSALNDMKIVDIDELVLEKECNRIVREFNLPYKEWCNAKTIVNGMYDYAVRKKYLKENPLKNVQIHIKFRQVTRKTGKTETFNTEELQRLIEFLDRLYEETSDTSYLAVKLNFLLGLRVGELVALKWEDWCDPSRLHIVREEVKDQTDNSYSVVEHTKTNRDRFVIVVPKAAEILNKFERAGEYIFMRDGKRITAIRISTILRKYANYYSVPLKSSHKMRKTYASLLHAHGVPLDCIREMLGHSSLATTLSYIYNPLTDAETYDLISKAL